MEILETSSSGILPGESQIVITILYIDTQLSSVRLEPNNTLRYSAWDFVLSVP